MHNLCIFKSLFFFESRQVFVSMMIRTCNHVDWDLNKKKRKKFTYYKFIYEFCLFLNAIKIFYHGNDIYKRYFYPILLKGFFYPQCNSLFPFIMSTTHACVTRIHKIGVQWERHAFEHRILASYESFRE